MSAWPGHLRRKILTPDARQTSLAVRGFPVRNRQARTCLETAGATFVEGFAVAAESGTAAEAVAAISEIDDARRGFAFEGAAMAAAIRDALPIGHRHHVADLRIAADEHVYMITVGAGWALARLPRPLHHAALTGLTDPVLIWLALDGYGFHQAYFHTDRYVHRQYADPAPPLVSARHREYAPHAIDQGIGRALWFVSGADPELASTLVARFLPDRRPDLFAGLGLAATYAGGATPDELAGLCARAGVHRRCLAQGAIFAAEARDRAGLMQPATETAVRIITGYGVTDAARLAVETRPAEPTVDGRVAYEVWRERIRRRALDSPIAEQPCDAKNPDVRPTGPTTVEVETWEPASES